MSRLFVSYKREDADYAFAVRQWLIDNRAWGAGDIFVDLGHLTSGVEWAKKLFEEVEECQAMLFLASEGALLHPESFCYHELLRALGVAPISFSWTPTEDGPYGAVSRYHERS